MKEICGIQVPDNIKLLISFPGVSQEEAAKIGAMISKYNNNTSVIVTNCKLKVIAWNNNIMVIEARIK